MKTRRAGASPRPSLRASRFLIALLATLPGWASARAWGCRGHEVIALIAEAHLTPHARSAALRLLSDNPIATGLPRSCPDIRLDPFVDASTWADDIRGIRPDTTRWHFIDIPRGARKEDLERFCPPEEGCILTALPAELNILRNPRASPQARAEALRFVIHLAGDIHQPLHAATNDDRAGNCVPVAYFGRNPQLTDPWRGDYSPNLHQVWDVEIIARWSRGRTLQEVVRRLDAQFRTRAAAWLFQPADFDTWAWEAHELAEFVAYGRLPRPIAIEPPRRVRTCLDNHSVSTRMLRLRERLSSDYQDAAVPVVERQLAKAGVRLAALLNSIWP